jgi:hypothetical protein
MVVILSPALVNHTSENTEVGGIYALGVRVKQHLRSP